MSLYHGRKISGSRQQAAQATTATTMRMAKKRQACCAKQQLCMCSTLFCYFLAVDTQQAHETPNLTRLLYGFREHNTNIFFSSS